MSWFNTVLLTIELVFTTYHILGNLGHQGREKKGRRSSRGEVESDDVLMYHLTEEHMFFSAP